MPWWVWLGGIGAVLLGVAIVVMVVVTRAVRDAEPDDRDADEWLRALRAGRRQD